MPKLKIHTYPCVLKSRYGRVRIACERNRGKWNLYRVYWRVGKKTMRKSFSDEHIARSHAEDVLEQFAAGHPLVGKMTTSDAIYIEECRKKLNGVPLMDVVDFYLAHKGLNTPDSGDSVEQIAADFVKDLQAQGNSARDIETVRSHLRSAEAGLPRVMNAITAKHIDEFLQGKAEWTNRTRKNVRISLCRLWAWAFAKGRLPKHLENAALASSSYKPEKAGSPGIFTPNQFESILGVAEEEWLPYLAICGFAGVRQAEAQRLLWGDIRLDEKVLVLESRVTKTAKRRVVLMPDNLVEWLSDAPNRDPKSKICPGKNPNRATKRAADKAGVKWVQNGLRHSNISYQMAIIRDSAKVAEQHGNSAEEVQASYKANALESEALMWYNIFPTPK